MALDAYLAMAASAAMTVAYQSAFFLVAYTMQIDKVTDFAGGSNFALVAMATLFLGENQRGERSVVVTTLVALWALRLAVFLLLRILSWGEDRRFDEMRSDFFKFAAFWLAQAVWVWTVTLPVQLLNGGAGNAKAPISANALDVIGLVLFGYGLLLEAWADQAKLNFKNNPESRGNFCNVGPWRWSRHPNYAGEMSLWIGIFLVCVRGFAEGNARWSDYVLASLSPAFIVLLLLFGSGLPLLEASSNRRYGLREDYRVYRERTSPLIPLPPALYALLPLWLKRAALFEWPLYETGLATAMA